MEQRFKLRFPQYDHGVCRLCARNGTLLRGQLLNQGVDRSTSPSAIGVQIGPYCRNHGGQAKVEFELIQMLEDPDSVPYAKAK